MAFAAAVAVADGGHEDVVGGFPGGGGADFGDDGIAVWADVDGGGGVGVEGGEEAVVGAGGPVGGEVGGDGAGVFVGDGGEGGEGVAAGRVDGGCAGGGGEDGAESKDDGDA